MITRVILLAAMICALSTRSRAETASGAYTFEFNDSPNLWDISGSYSEQLDDLAMDYTIAMDPSGKFTGQGFASDIDSGFNLAANFSVIGTLKSAGNLTRISMNWKMIGTIEGDGASGVFTATMKQNLEIDSAGHQMLGTFSGKITISIPGEGRETAKIPLSETATELPEDMNGAWSLKLNITALDTKYSGLALVQLSNGKELPLDLTGTYAAKTGESNFSLKGQGPNRALKMKLNSSVTNGQMNLNRFAGTVLGQKVAAPTVY